MIKCARCKEPINFNLKKINGKMYHKECIAAIRHNAKLDKIGNGRIGLFSTNM